MGIAPNTVWISIISSPSAPLLLPEKIEINGYQIIAPNREFYIQGGQEQDNDSYITEIQFPVQKV